MYVVKGGQSCERLGISVVLFLNSCWRYGIL